MVQSALTIRGLRYAYGAHQVVDGIDLEASVGSVLGVLGPNGAGKSTTISLAVGTRRPDAGTVEIFGLDPYRRHEETSQLAGVMLQDGGPPMSAKPMAVPRHLASLYADPRPLSELAGVLGIPEFAGRSIRRLSGGQRQRVALAAALIGRPRIVFLDEPSAGLDPQAREVVHDVIRDLAASGVAVVLTTHDLAEAEPLADDIVVIDRGRIIARGAPEAPRLLGRRPPPRHHRSRRPRSALRGGQAPVRVAQRRRPDHRPGNPRHRLGRPRQHPHRRPVRGHRRGGTDDRGHRDAVAVALRRLLRTHREAPAMSTLEIPRVRGMRARRVLSQARFETVAVPRNGEQLLLALILPLGLLVFLTTTPALEALGAIPAGGDRLSIALPGTLGLCLASTAFTGQAIATAFDRRYGVLAQLATTPLGTTGLILGKLGAVIVVVLIQYALAFAIACMFGFAGPVHVLPLIVATVLGTATLLALGPAHGRDPARGGDARGGQPRVGAHGRRRRTGPARDRGMGHRRRLPALRGARRRARASVGGGWDVKALIVLLVWGIVGALAARRWFRFE